MFMKKGVGWEFIGTHLMWTKTRPQVHFEDSFIYLFFLGETFCNANFLDRQSERNGMTISIITCRNFPILCNI